MATNFKNPPVRPKSSLEDFSRERQSLLMRELELLLDLKPRALDSRLLALPKGLREKIIIYLLPDTETGSRPELHTCFWAADMIDEPWRNEVFGYAPSVVKRDRLRPQLLLINRQLRYEILELYFSRSRVTLHAELRNTIENNWQFDYSPYILQFPMLKFVTHVRFYIEWNYTITDSDPTTDQIRMISDLMQAKDVILAPLQRVEEIDLSILFFWRRSRKIYHLSMQNLFELEDIFKQQAEKRWLQILRPSESMNTSLDVAAGVGYKLVPEAKDRKQSGEMEIYASRNLEEAMRNRRKSSVDYYGNYRISDPLPQPAFRQH
ncbi:hypothetical protein GQ43DRAFT_383854 [Delitschia confertaspora ATCC 74209]|uniref:F-box domain-containing protein n=1 Tax=Delitschia confertaspora ATCC 74209 TaxID=1513339 RepID=A0A9P4JE66_9PLEO|nr:hypothetical protein GQ43DRAFT_383854 [Delitschia confertaspora ATCC 74209]